MGEGVPVTATDQASGNGELDDLAAQPSHRGPQEGFPERITIREVGPRDGLQPEEPVGVPARVKLVERLVDAGVVVIEAVAFVSPKAVPAMAGAGDVMAALARVPGVRYGALVPNVRGAQLAS